MFAVLPIKTYDERMCKLLSLESSLLIDLSNPDRIFERILRKNYTIKQIKDWEDFEYRLQETRWDEHYFYDLVFSGLPNQNIMLLTHYGVYRKECYEFDLDSFYEFVEWYNDRYEDSFIIARDYVFILENNLIKAIHHGGVIMEQHTHV